MNKRFFVNGRFVRGAQPFAVFEALTKEKWAKADEIIRIQGVQPHEYYDMQVMAKGRKEP
jgi:hypothetical protein